MLDLLTAAPKEVAFGARTYRVGALKMRELGLLQRFVRDHAVRPTVRARAEAEFLDEADRRQHMKEAVLAERDWPPAVGTADGNRVLLGDEEGQRHFLRVMLGKYQPGLADEEVEALMAGLSEEDFGLLVAIAFGEDDLDPEAARAAVRERLRALLEAVALAQTPAPDGEAAPTGASASST